MGPLLLPVPHAFRNCIPLPLTLNDQLHLELFSKEPAKLCEDACGGAKTIELFKFAKTPVAQRARTQYFKTNLILTLECP